MSSQSNHPDHSRTRKPWGFAKFFSVWFFGALAAIFASIWIASIASTAAKDNNFVPVVAVLLIVGAIVYDQFIRTDPADEAFED